jgi:hypothetical protein
MTDDMAANVEHVPYVNTCDLHYTENQCSLTEGERLIPGNCIDQPIGAYAVLFGAQ